MNNPLRYQITEYDCGPTSVLNGISALFPREVIPPDIPRYVMLYSLDGWGEDGVIGTTGTTATAMMFMSNWFNSYGRLGRIPISSHFYTGAQVNMREDGPVMEALHRGGVVVLRCYSDVAHYVLLTGIQDGLIQTFDPYFWDGPFGLCHGELGDGRRLLCLRPERTEGGTGALQRTHSSDRRKNRGIYYLKQVRRNPL